MNLVDLDHVLKVCTLPTVERPVRIVEFDRLFAQAAATVVQLGPRTARIRLPPRPETVAEAANLIVRESQCCSFFVFSLVVSGGRVHLDVSVPASQTAVLNSLVGWVERVGTA